MTESGNSSENTSSKQASSSGTAPAEGAPASEVAPSYTSIPTFSAKDPESAPPTNDANFEADAPRDLTEYEERYVAFVDILGFKEMISRSEREIDVVAQLAAALDVTFSPSTYSIVLEELRAQEADVDLRVNTFSDFVVASTNSSAAGLSVLLYVLWTLSTGWLSSNILCRGGITRGKVLHRLVTTPNKPTMVFGPAFVEAYKLESTVADFPRIILSHRVRQDWLSYLQNSRLGTQIPMLVHKCHDGPHCVDTFCHLRKNPFSLVSADTKLEPDQMRIALKKHLDLTAETPAVYRKAHWLAERFNSAIHRSKHADLSIDDIETT